MTALTKHFINFLTIVIEKFDWGIHIFIAITTLLWNTERFVFLWNTKRFVLLWNTWTDYIFQEKAAKYWVSKGTPKHKLNIGIATYGRSFVLADPVNDFGIGAPVTGPGSKGTFTQEMGFYSYYEVSYSNVFVKFSWINMYVWRHVWKRFL